MFMKVKHMVLSVAAFTICCLLTTDSQAQYPVRQSSGDILQSIKKLRVLGSAMYVAAHPDDENTRLISYLANAQNVHTTYLSLTRGDGGQNLIGPELSAFLGVIRTQELLEARKIDRGFQLFARANDFGYSKTPDETLEIWNRDSVLADVVWAIRKLRPDIIINRFSSEHMPGNHGHHTASAMLAEDAFELAGREDVFPWQLRYVEPWRPSRLFFNTSWWFYGSRERFDAVDKSDMIMVDVGTYFPLYGYSNTEIAARSRSMHKSQGFGASGTRGEAPEYLELIMGDMPEGSADLFTGIDITWNRIEGGARIDVLLAAAEQRFDHERPYLSVVPLLTARKAILALESSYWRDQKLDEINAVIAACMGLFVEAVAADYFATPGDSIMLNLEVIHRSPLDVALVGARTLPAGEDLGVASVLLENAALTERRTIYLPADLDYTTPYWLNQKGTPGLYKVEEQELIGLPETPRQVAIGYALVVAGDTLYYTVPAVFKRTDPVDGEVYRPFEIVPPAFVNIESSVYVFRDHAPRTINIVVRSARAVLSGSLHIEAPPGWIITPKEVEVQIPSKGDEAVFSITVLPPEYEHEGTITAHVEVNVIRCSQSIIELNYSHIAPQTVLLPTEAKVVRLDLKKEPALIAYLPGAGDDVPASLTDMGYQVEIVTPEQLQDASALKRFDAIVTGIRAYNTQERLRHAQGALMEYVASGGTLIVQYNTHRGWVTEAIAPYPMQIGRGRVTDEGSPVEILTPEHPVVHTPNRIKQADFEGWVQERGLYFADSWDARFTPILSMADPGEDPLLGSLLVAQYGNGYFVYTGLSLFRQLPAGVPGAFRLMANLIALGQNDRS